MDNYLFLSLIMALNGQIRPWKETGEWAAVIGRKRCILTKQHF